MYPSALSFPAQLWAKNNNVQSLLLNSKNHEESNKKLFHNISQEFRTVTYDKEKLSIK